MSFLKTILDRLEEQPAELIWKFVIERSVTHEQLARLIDRIKAASSDLSKVITGYQTQLKPRSSVARRTDDGCRLEVPQHIQNSLWRTHTTRICAEFLTQPEDIIVLMRRIVYHILLFAVTYTHTKHTEFIDSESNRIVYGEPFYVYRTQAFIDQLQRLVPQAGNLIKPKHRVDPDDELDRYR